MKIFVDSLEAEKQPIIVAALKNSGKNEVIIKRLECGDYFCPPVLVEAKNNLSDYVGSVKSGLIFQQAQDMLFSRQQNFDLKLYILVADDIANLWKLQQHQSVQALPLIAAWASLNVQGIPTIFIGNQWFFIKGLLYLFEKYNDGKKREYNPVRAPITMQHQILTNYCSIPNVGEKTAWKLADKFKTPKALYNATREQLLEIGIGEKLSKKMIAFFNGGTDVK